MTERLWTVMDLIRTTAEYLAKKGVESARLDAELLLAGILGVRRLDLYLQFDRPVEPAELAEYRSRVRRRAAREPLQYIEGATAFRHLTLAVDGRVLVPRPETEVLVSEVLAWARGRSGLVGVDVGTGSGAIALALVTEGPFARMVATDLSAAALEVAGANVARVGVEDRIELRSGDLLAPLPEGEVFDVVVSNPPYIGREERAALSPEVGEWEPEMALFAEEGGLAVYRRLVEEAPAHGRPGGLLAVEVGWTQAARVADMMRETGRYGDIRIRKDLAGRERFVLAEFIDTE